jgi:hypothetical protein
MACPPAKQRRERHHGGKGFGRNRAATGTESQCEAELQRRRSAPDAHVGGKRWGRNRAATEGKPPHDAQRCSALDAQASGAHPVLLGSAFGAARKGGHIQAEKDEVGLPDLTKHLVKCGALEEYTRWREAYRRWREGDGKGARDDMLSGNAEGTLQFAQTWRDGYRSWRRGGINGARGAVAEMQAVGLQSDQPLAEMSELPPVVYDVVVTPGGEPGFVPSSGPATEPIHVQDFPPEALLTIRVFRFFEDFADEGQDWERCLRNVNSGSISWLPWHLAPNMHSKGGAKYGTWFTIHYVQVYAKHFKSAYHMCNEGASPAKTFGTSPATSKAITGEALSAGYFWYVSPVIDHAKLESQGWRHLHRAGPFDGKRFLELWTERKSPMEVKALQEVLAKVVQCSAETKV